MASGTVFVRRATVFLVILCAILSIAFVVVLALLLRPSCQDRIAGTESSNQTDVPSTTATPVGPQEAYMSDYRLPKDTLPLAYDLYLFPMLEEGIFTGRVNILIDSQSTRDFFAVHTKYLDIDPKKTVLYKGEVKDTKYKREVEDDEKVQVEDQLEYKPNEFWVVKTKDTEPGLYTLHLEFTGNLTKAITGFYRSVYTNSAGVKRYMATSKFQPTYARRAFPCFDEPSFKSNFTVTLVRPSGDGYIALSNMDVDSETEDSPKAGFTEVKFKESVPMVTYLACFIVCDFQYKEKLTKSNKKFRVYAQPDQIDRVDYALELGTNTLDYFEEYFEIPYPLPKQDMIAIPDFVSGAMEHWGLITYREANLLYDEKESSSSNKQRVATVVSHELVHMWFGNLVTLEWWNDIWLNEGFASYIEYRGVNQFETEWDMLSQFVVADFSRAMNLDAALNSHPIVQEANSPDEITQMFDAISYSKGSSVLRMLENVMGEENFRKGIHRFLKKFIYKNAVTQDLWDSLHEQMPELKITEVMDTWTRQMGFPVVNVTKKSETEYTLSQFRFLKNSESEFDYDESPFRYRWEIQVSYFTSADPNKTEIEWMHKTGMPKTIQLDSPVKWIKFNRDQMGFYRVNYPAEMWKALTDVLKEDPESLSSSDRASLLSDSFSLADSGYISYDIPLDMCLTLKKDDYLVPWDAAFPKLLYIEQRSYSTEVYRSMKKFLFSLSEDLFKKFGWEDTGPHTTRLQRIQIVELACRSGNVECLKTATEKFDNWIKDESYYIPPNLRTKVYKHGIRSSKLENKWDVMWERYKEETNAQEKVKLLFGLAQTNEPWRLHRFLELAKDESNVRSQDFFTAIRYVAGNHIGEPIAWDFYRSNWEYLVERFTLNDRYLGRTISSVAGSFSTEYKLKEVEAFFEQYPDAGAGSRSRQQVLEKIKNNIEWLKTNQKSVHSWLMKNTT